MCKFGIGISWLFFSQCNTAVIFDRSSKICLGLTVQNRKSFIIDNKSISAKAYVV